MSSLWCVSDLHGEKKIKSFLGQLGWVVVTLTDQSILLKGAGEMVL